MWVAIAVSPTDRPDEQLTGLAKISGLRKAGQIRLEAHGAVEGSIVQQLKIATAHHEHINCVIYTTVGIWRMLRKSITGLLDCFAQ